MKVGFHLSHREHRREKGGIWEVQLLLDGDVHVLIFSQLVVEGVIRFCEAETELVLPMENGQR